MNRCSLCPGDHNCVPPSGPPDSSILFLGEGPGWEEDKKLMPFVGKTGREVNEHYMPLAGLRRENFCFDNTMKCMPKGINGKMDLKRASDRELAEECFNTHVAGNIMCNHYTLIVAMGAFACHVLEPRINLDLHHGIPVSTKWGTVFPMYHPAGGIHEPKKMLLIRNDWVRLRKYLAGKLRIFEDIYAGQEEYGVVESPGHLESILDQHGDDPLANDTESTRDREPFCITLSVKPGTGWLIRSDRLDILETYQTAIDGWRGPIIWHNWLYDQAVCRKMGISFRKRRRQIVDTMARSFQLGNLPQGLKALSFRELGMEMQDFDDLVSPYSTKLVLEYYNKAFWEEWDKPQEELVRDSTGAWKVYKPQGMKTKLKRFFTDYSKATSKGIDKDVFGAWANWETSHKLIEDRCGRWPGKCITHAPFDKVLHYACRDADATLRLYHVINRMRNFVRKTTQEHWRDFA